MLSQQSGTGLRNLIPTGLRTRIRQWLGPLTLSGAAEGLQAVIDQVQTRPGARHAHPLRGHAGRHCQSQ